MIMRIFSRRNDSSAPIKVAIGQDEIASPEEPARPDDEIVSTNILNRREVRTDSQNQSLSKIIEQVEQLPDAVRMYGSSKSDTSLTRQQRDYLGALIHGDGSATFLMTQEALRTAHVCNAFRKAMLQSGVTEIRDELLVKTHVLASAYHQYDRELVSEKNSHSTKTTNSQNLMFALDIIERGMLQGASDIHLENRDSPNEQISVVKFRIDGELEIVDVYTAPAELELARKVPSVLFQSTYSEEQSKSNSQQSNHVNQHALVRIQEKNNVALRYQSMVEKDGSDLSLRILTWDGKPQAIADLPATGLELDQCAMLVDSISRPYGASFIGGPTGGGKTTLIAAIMAADPYQKVRRRLSAEDPVEIDIPHFSQHPVKRASNDLSDGPFIEALKTFVRADPDVIVIGEIRERAAASLFIHAALTGHNVWTTIHVNRMFDTILRLTEPTMGIQASLLGSDNVLNLLGCQTLVRTLCSCKIPVEDAVRKGLISDRLLQNVTAFGIPVKSLYAANRATENNKNDCPICKGKGEKGRTACAEFTLVDEELKDSIMQGRFSEVEKTYRKRRTTSLIEPGMAGKTMLDHGFLKASRGEICISRLPSIAGELQAEYKTRQNRGYRLD